MHIWNMERQKATIKIHLDIWDQELYTELQTVDSMGKRRKKGQISGSWDKQLTHYGKFLKLVHSDMIILC